ncbi:MAG: SAM-dependent methyltransferase [Hyphomicrobiales bacterium]|nr:methyltransferase domain-containing protein [Hyphomicrobiales bacterium]PCH51149.1 MAG: SAM-dependent methyltransferase [Hyphomicrobiales bacterium]
MKLHSKKIAKSMADDLRFIKGWIKEPKTVGSIKPTGRAAAKLMVQQIPEGDLPILELGPGTGVITAMMLEMGYDPKRIVSVEFDPEFCTHLRKEFPEVNFIEGDAFNLDETLKDLKGQKFGAILSGIPLLNFAKDERQKLVSGALEWVANEGPFVQLCYGPKAPVPEKENVFKARPTKWVLANIPPARFWIYESVK